MTNKPGVELTCKDCGRKFTFTDDEKAFYDSKGLQEPKRCYHCRSIAKITRRETMNVLKKYGLIRYEYSDATESGTEEA